MAVLMALLSSTPALAVVDPYEVLTITPAEGQVDSLRHFTITFAGLPVKVDENAVPTLQKGGGNTIEGTMRADDDGTTVVIDFDQCCTASGHYFLNLPEGSLTVNGQRLLPLSLRFIIQGDMDSFYEQITIKPDQGVLESIKSFTISFPEYIGETTYGSRALLTNTTTGNIYHAEIMDVGYNALVYFTSEITEPGDYTLTIPAGSLVFSARQCANSISISPLRAQAPRSMTSSPSIPSQEPSIACNGSRLPSPWHWTASLQVLWPP